MELDKSLKSAAAELRRQAEEQLRTKTAELRLPRTDEETQRLVHELEVHQIELEMQNAELRRVRDEQEMTLEKYSDLYDFAPVGYFTLDRDEIIRAVNLTGANLIGVERTQLVGRRFGLLVAVEARPALTAFLGKVFVSPVKEACEVPLLKGENHPLFVQIEAVVAASGQECRAAVIDISARRQLEEKLGLLHTELAAANQELEAFNYTVAHDLRRPLTLVNGYCQAIKEFCGDQLDEVCKGYLLEAYEGTWQMNRLIDALLNFSRMAHAVTRRETVDLSAMAREVGAELKLSEPGRQVDFYFYDGVVANADANLLRVVLDNLLGNAWKYTCMREKAVIEFGVTDLGGVQTYFVRDNGEGFDKTEADKLFIPFQRLPGVEKFKGFGIGLATVERIVRRHGGRVWAESEPGKGATFWFTLE